jgi:hypothetical protein
MFFRIKAYSGLGRGNSDGTTIEQYKLDNRTRLIQFIQLIFDPTPYASPLKAKFQPKLGFALKTYASPQKVMPHTQGIIHLTPSTCHLAVTIWL